MKKILAAATSLCLAIGLSACAPDSKSPELTDAPTSTRSESQPTSTVQGSADPKVQTPATQATAKSSATVEKPKRWVEVFRSTARQQDSVQNMRTKIFHLDGDARIRYVVTGKANRPENQGRAADTMFQDKNLDTESSRVDTTIEVDEPGKGTQDLGERNGSYFLMLNARGGTVEAESPGAVPMDGWRDINVTAIVEEMK